MPKQLSGRRKGIQRFIPRHRVGNKKFHNGHQDDNTETTRRVFSYFSRSKYTWIGQKTFEILLAGCEKFHLIGFTRSKTGEYVPLGRKALILHYFTIAICLAICVQKTWWTAHVLFYEELRVESFMCLSLALAYIIDVLLSLGVLMKPKETMDLLNSWTRVSASVEKIDPSFKFNPLNNISACSRSVASALVGQGAVFGTAIISLVMSDLPVFLLPMAQSAGLIPAGLLPKWAWQVMFAFMEGLMVEPFVLIGSLNPNLLYMGSGALEIFLEQLRHKVRCLTSRRQLEQMYVELELFNRIAQVWIRFYFPPWLLALSIGVIVGAFASIRFTELPLIIYIFCPYVASTLMVLIFWQSYDMLRVVRASEDILGGLRQHEAPYFRGMTRAKRVELMKRSRAMRPVTFTVAHSEYSLNLPISTWDEIINQTLFLLSL